MTRLSILALAFIGCTLVFAGNVNFKRVSGPSGLTMSFEVTVSKAYAARRAARRHHRRRARRVARRRHRVIRRTRLSSSCVWRAPYHYCSGVYYRTVVTSGATSYVVVYP